MSRVQWNITQKSTYDLVINYFMGPLLLKKNISWIPCIFSIYQNTNPNKKGFTFADPNTRAVKKKP
jgi:hypothetical protein